MKRISLNPPELFNSVEFGFSQINIAEAGKMVFISGQVAWDENRNIVGKDDLAVQGQQALDNLRIAMEAAGGSLADIVMLRIYVVKYQSAYGPIISELLKANFDHSSLPASTWISVEGLANAEFMIEIEAQAMI